MDSVESAAFTLRVPSGCVYEPAERGGLATLVSELVMRGCGNRDSRALVTALDNLGVERGEGVADSHTTFSGATLARNLFPALEIYADIVRRPHFPDDELEPARAMALQELAAVADEPSQKVMLELRKRYYVEPWGRPSQGTEAGLESSTMADVRAMFARGYRPNGAILGVAGRVDWPQLKAHVEKLFGDWARAAADEPAEGTGAPINTHMNFESGQTQVAIAYPSVPYRDPDYYQAAGAVGVLSGGMSSRLFTEVREKRGLCYSVYATQTSLRNHGSVVAYAGTRADRAQETLDVMLGELRRLANGIEPQELDRLKARIKSSLVMQGESSGARASSISRDWYYLGKARTLDEVGLLVDALTCDSIHKYLEAHPPEKFTVVTLGPRALEVH
ncbi:MAG: insulinase family protein [Planctomycetes bacterium]|nr:insulinase family protein [Planctomycetota bacterium]